MLEAIFYDRKNKREVKNSELMFINYIVDVVTSEDGKLRYNPTIHELQLGELGYKSEECPKFVNWDLSCMYNDLIFLRFE